MLLCYWPITPSRSYKYRDAKCRARIQHAIRARHGITQRVTVSLALGFLPDPSHKGVIFGHGSKGKYQNLLAYSGM